MKMSKLDHFVVSFYLLYRLITPNRKLWGCGCGTR